MEDMAAEAVASGAVCSLAACSVAEGVTIITITDRLPEGLAASVAEAVASEALAAAEVPAAVELAGAAALAAEAEASAEAAVPAEAEPAGADLVRKNMNICINGGNMKYLLFDLDGTLMNTKEGIVKSVYYALDFLGVTEDEPEKLERFIGPPLDASFRDFYQMNETGVKRAVEKYRERYTKKGQYECEPYPGIPEMLRELKEKGNMLFVATSKPAVFAEEILRHHELSEYFDGISAATLDGTVSEKPDIIRAVLKKLPEVDKKDITMIGDRRFDILGAKECGIQSIGVRYGFPEPGELEEAEADSIADTVEQLRRILLEADGL